MGRASVPLSYMFGVFIAIVLFVEVKNRFFSEKAYLEISRDIYHSTPYCDKIDGLTESDKRYMSEAGSLEGTLERKNNECYNDISLKMCSYCFSPMEIKYRDKHLEHLRKKAKENTKLK